MQEAACVLLGCLADASSRARSKILRCRGVVQRLIKQVCSVPDSEVTNLLARAALSPMVACSPAHLRHGTDPGEGDTNEAHVASVAAASSKCALVATLAKLMQNAGPDNFVFQAAMQVRHSCCLRTWACCETIYSTVVCIPSYIGELLGLVPCVATQSRSLRVKIQSID